ncbi:MAG: thioredoxin, partial [Ilumatobacteraceae bacterium]
MPSPAQELSSTDLTDGLTVVVKRDCETCQMVEPVIAEIASVLSIRVITQDDPSFPGSVDREHDDELAFSWHHDIETVPTLIKGSSQSEDERTVGWSQAEWQRITGIDSLGADLPVMRPGCGSMSVDPNLIDTLRARF